MGKRPWSDFTVILRWGGSASRGSERRNRRAGRVSALQLSAGICYLYCYNTYYNRCYSAEPQGGLSTSRLPGANPAYHCARALDRRIVLWQEAGERQYNPPVTLTGLRQRGPETGDILWLSDDRS